MIVFVLIQIYTYIDDTGIMCKAKTGSNSSIFGLETTDFLHGDRLGETASVSMAILGWFGKSVGYLFKKAGMPCFLSFQCF